MEAIFVHYAHIPKITVKKFSKLNGFPINKKQILRKYSILKSKKKKMTPFRFNKCPDLPDYKVSIAVISTILQLLG